MQVAFMNQHSNAGIFSGTETIRYRYALKPDERLADGLNQWFKEMGYENAPALDKNKLSIAIAGFEATPRLEDTLSRWTQRICSQAGPFSLEFNNFGGEPPHRLFLRIQDLSPIRQLVSNLRKLDMYLTGNGQEPILPAARCFLPVWEGVPLSTFENLLYRLGRAELYLKVPVQSLLLQKLDRGRWVNVQHFSLCNSLLYKMD
jgi:hypothetical protein